MDDLLKPYQLWDLVKPKHLMVGHGYGLQAAALENSQDT
jgi:hypothetical protein